MKLSLPDSGHHGFSLTLELVNPPPDGGAIDAPCRFRLAVQALVKDFYVVGKVSGDLIDDDLFDRGPMNSDLVGTQARFHPRAAAVVVLRNDAEAASAVVADDQPGQQVRGSRPPSVKEAPAHGDPLLRRIPEIVRNDAQILADAISHLSSGRILWTRRPVSGFLIHSWRLKVKRPLYFGFRNIIAIVLARQRRTEPSEFNKVPIFALRIGELVESSAAAEVVDGQVAAGPLASQHHQLTELPRRLIHVILRVEEASRE